MSDLSDVTLAVLAGGAGRRMGRPKAWLTLDGEPIVARLHRRLAWPGPTLLVTSPGRERPPGVERFDLEVCDPVADEGPLRGIATALFTATTSLVAVVPADMPNVAVVALKRLVDATQTHSACGGACFQTVDGPRPLPAVLRQTLREAALRSVNAGQFRLRTWEREQQVIGIAVPENLPQDFFRNLNEPGD